MESPIQEYLESLLADVQRLRGGAPYLVHPPGREPNPEDFGICLATVDGRVYSVGVADQEFSIQSISKPFSYGLALADYGFEAVDEKVDVEPSGDPFNQISLAPVTGRPPNAMVNAGALAVASMIRGGGGKSAVRRIVDTYSRFAGRELSSSRAVFDVEIRHSDRNHALAYLLSSVEVIENDPSRALENYLRQCSVQVTCRDLAMMAATLANGGTQPVSGEQVLEIDVVERVLSVMMTSGMYDDAGAWVSSVGMPAKSGVGGGTLAVLPGQAGLAVFSPPLDGHGNSVRGLETCRRVSKDMEMHFVRAARSGRSAIKDTMEISRFPSRVRRTEEEAEVLERYGDRARIIEVTGDLFFAGTESLVRAVSELEDGVVFVVLDLRQVYDAGRLARQMITGLQRQLAAAGRELVLVTGEEAPALIVHPDADPECHGTPVPVFQGLGEAVEHCENALLERYGAPVSATERVPVTSSPALDLLEEADRERLAALMERRFHEDGDVIRRVGQRFGGVHFIVSGQINTIATNPLGERVRLNTLGAGMTFGELALGTADRQETTEKAVGEVELMVLTPEAIEVLEQDDPALALHLWRALTRDAYSLVDRYLREAAVRLTY
ncbi:glutaminase A [Citricoccus sp.]|uniref:glutaminase A n=2 Tax=Citricoccus sp. TaxID=1978372 RepID=UPI0028BF4947|nr:glutaminase A [Citricoccus sp.]